MSAYGGSLSRRTMYIAMLTVTRIAHVGVSITIAAAPTLVAAGWLGVGEYGAVALLGIAVSQGSAIARDIFDAGGYRAILSKAAEADSEDGVDLRTVATGIAYINALVVVGVALGAVLVSTSPAAAALAALLYGPLDIDWGDRADRVAPVWFLVTAASTRVGVPDPLSRIQTQLRATGGDVVHLLQPRKQT